MSADALPSHATAEEVFRSIRSLLTPAADLTDMMQCVATKQEQLLKDIESLNEELRTAKTRFADKNDEQRRELEMYCARIFRCRSRVEILFRQLVVIKQRLQRVRGLVLQNTAIRAAENKALSSQMGTSAHPPDDTLCEKFHDVDLTPPIAATIATPATTMEEEIAAKGMRADSNDGIDEDLDENTNKSDNEEAPEVVNEDEKEIK